MNNVMLAVLAGGEGSRMGRPKAELRVGGLPILEYLLRQWNWPGARVLITAPGREHPPGCEAFDREISDPVAGQGPLRGVLTALELCGKTEAVVVATCDMPLVTREMLTKLIEHLNSDTTLVAAMMNSENGVEPFPMALRPGIRDEVRARLERNERSVRSVAELPSVAAIPGPADAGVWTNLNRPGDSARFGATFADHG